MRQSGAVSDLDDAQSQTWRDLDGISRAHRIYLANYQELDDKLEVPDDPGQWLPISNQGSGRLIRFLGEVERLLHNFLAAAYTLSSTLYTVANRRWPRGTRERQAYEQETPFRRPGIIAFVYGLRNLAQHDTIPLTFNREEWRRNPDGSTTWTASIILNRDALLRLDWGEEATKGTKQPPENRLGREYLDHLGHDPDLRQVIREFSPAAVRFTAWFFDHMADDFGLLPPEHQRLAQEWRGSIELQ
jgi:hypothetical protein